LKKVLDETLSGKAPASTQEVNNAIRRIWQNEHSRTPYSHSPIIDFDVEYEWEDFQEMLGEIMERLDALDSSSKERQTSQIVDKCEETLGSDANTEKDVPDEIEQQLSSVSLSRQKIEQAKRHEALSWTACYDDSCWTHMEDKEGSGWFPRAPSKPKSLF
jgi:hypothetical protein